MEKEEFTLIRKDLGLGVTALAKYLECTRQKIHKIESGFQRIPSETAMIMKALKDGDISVKKGSSDEHAELVESVLLAIGRRSDLKAVKRDVFSGRTSRGSWVKAGRNGEADIEIVLAPIGRVLYLEAKTGNATQSEAQKGFQDYMESVGAQYHVFRSVEEALEIIEKAKR